MNSYKIRMAGWWKHGRKQPERILAVFPFWHHYRHTESSILLILIS